MQPALQPALDAHASGSYPSTSVALVNRRTNRVIWAMAFIVAALIGVAVLMGNVLYATPTASAGQVPTRGQSATESSIEQQDLQLPTLSLDGTGN
jgi:hypothetical protein